MSSSEERHVIHYNLEALEGEVARRTKERWEQQVAEFAEPEAQITANRYERLLEWAIAHANDTDDGYVYGLVHEDEGYAHAILTLTHARPKSKNAWLKVLEVRLEPQLDDDVRDSLDAAYYGRAYDILSASILLSLEKTFRDHPAKQLKVYGRSPEMQRLFDFFVFVSEKREDFVYKVQKQGKWLVFDKQ